MLRFASGISNSSLSIYGKCDASSYQTEISAGAKGASGVGCPARLPLPILSRLLPSDVSSLFSISDGESISSVYAILCLTVSDNLHLKPSGSQNRSSRCVGVSEVLTKLSSQIGFARDSEAISFLDPFVQEWTCPFRQRRLINASLRLRAVTLFGEQFHHPAARLDRIYGSADGVARAGWSESSCASSD
jgi:hypothetical protein